MFHYKGGDQPKNGIFLNLTDWQIVTLPSADNILPGNADREYLRLPAILFVPLALGMGGAYVMYLPFIGFAVVFHALAKATGRTLRSLII